jgi:hypothetical protein
VLYSLVETAKLHNVVRPRSTPYEPNVV